MNAQTIPEHRGDTDPRVLIGRAIDTAGSVIGAVRPDQLDSPTPCTEMDVRAMLGHLVGVIDRIAALGRGEDPFAAVDVSAPDDGWCDTWTASVRSLVDAWQDDAVLDQPMELPWIQGDGAKVLSSYYSELTVHTWDLAVATGQRPVWDDDVISAALETGSFLPAENRLALFEEISAAMGLDEVGVPFADAIQTSDDAPAIDRLVAWNGRDPGWG